MRRAESRAEGIVLSLFAASVLWIGIKGRDLSLPLKVFSNLPAPALCWVASILPWFLLVLGESEKLTRQEAPIECFSGESFK